MAEKQYSLPAEGENSGAKPDDDFCGNRLLIRSDGLNLDLSGSSAEVRRAYRALRTQLVERFYDTMADQRRPQHRTLELPRVSRDSKDAGRPRRAGRADKARPQRAGAAAPQADENYINLVICEESYHKMYFLDEMRFKKGFLGALLDIVPLRRVYINAGVEERVRKRLDIGSTLWRELTPAGKAAMEGSD